MRYVEMDPTRGCLTIISTILGVKDKKDKASSIKEYLENKTKEGSSYQSALINQHHESIELYHTLFDKLLKTVGVVIKPSKMCCFNFKRKKNISIPTCLSDSSLNFKTIFTDQETHNQVKAIKLEIDFLDKLNDVDIKCLGKAGVRRLPLPPPPEFI